VRERYHNSLNPEVKRSDWTPAEDALIINLHGQWGNKWAKMAECLPGRTDNAIKNRWNSTLKKSAGPALPVSTPARPEASSSPILKEDRVMEAPFDLFS
jgi:hypothetical protein